MLTGQGEVIDIETARVALISAVPSVKLEIDILVARDLELLCYSTHERVKRLLVEAVCMRPQDIDCL